MLDDLEEWDGMARGSLEREGIGIHVDTQLIHFAVQQKLTQHCKEIILSKKY